MDRQGTGEQPKESRRPAAWLAVVSHEHVRRAVELGIAQVNHGSRAGLARMEAGDWMIYYSPKERRDGGEPVKAFTAIGQVADDEIWQADDGDFHPFRRRIEYLQDAVVAPVAQLQPVLDLTAGPNWGYQLRRGLLELSAGDLDRIREAMGALGTSGAAG
jgi:hypothetical protein